MQLSTKIRISINTPESKLKGKVLIKNIIIYIVPEGKIAPATNKTYWVTKGKRISYEIKENNVIRLLTISG